MPNYAGGVAEDADVDIQPFTRADFVPAKVFRSRSMNTQPGRARAGRVTLTQSVGVARMFKPCLRHMHLLFSPIPEQLRFVVVFCQQFSLIMNNSWTLGSQHEQTFFELLLVLAHPCLLRSYISTSSGDIRDRVLLRQRTFAPVDAPVTLAGTV